MTNVRNDANPFPSPSGQRQAHEMPDGRGATATAAEPEEDARACEQRERVGGGAATGHGGHRQRLAEVGNAFL